MSALSEKSLEKVSASGEKSFEKVSASGEKSLEKVSALGEKSLEKVFKSLQIYNKNAIFAALTRNKYAKEEDRRNTGSMEKRQAA